MKKPDRPQLAAVPGYPPGKSLDAIPVLILKKLIGTEPRRTLLKLDDFVVCVTGVEFCDEIEARVHNG